jgi:hypothetical protein
MYTYMQEPCTKDSHFTLAKRREKQGEKSSAEVPADAPNLGTEALGVSDEENKQDVATGAVPRHSAGTYPSTPEQVVKKREGKRGVPKWW